MVPASCLAGGSVSPLAWCAMRDAGVWNTVSLSVSTANMLPSSRPVHHGRGMPEKATSS